MTRGLWPLCATVLLAVACRDTAPPVTGPATIRVDQGFTVVPRPSCTTRVLEAVVRPSPDALRRVVSAGATVSCGDAMGSTPLDIAVVARHVEAVRLLLESGADPNMRWGDRGDHLPLQEAIDDVSTGAALADRDEIVRLLLKHGADVNARWRPFASRVAWDAHVYWAQWGCVSEKGVTPLIEAAAADRADAVHRLLDAGADLRLEDWTGRAAIDYARSDIVRALLISASRSSTRAVSRPASAS
jgi:ankyrin repeat protein